MSALKAKAYSTKNRKQTHTKKMPHVAPATVLKHGSIYLHLHFAFHGSFPPTFPLLRQSLLPSSHCYCGETGSMRPRNASIDRFQHTHTHIRTYTDTHTLCPASFAGHCIWHVATISLTLHTHIHTHTRSPLA